MLSVPKKNSKIPLLVVTALAFVSLILFQTRDFSQAVQSPISAANLHKVVSLVILNIYLLGYLLLRGIPRRLAHFQYGYLLYIVVGGFSSVLFSSEKLFSIWKLYEVFAVFLLSVYVLSLSRDKPILSYSFYEMCLSFLKFMLVVTAIGAAIYPSEAFRSPLSDESLAVYGRPVLPFQIFGTIIQVNPNSLGAMSAILLFVYLRRYLSRRSSASGWFWIAFSGAFLILSQSRTAFFGLLCSFVLILVIDRNIMRRTKLTMMALLGVFGLLLAGTAVDYLTRGVDAERLATLSGRTIWWETAILEYGSAGVVEKLIGMGFATASRNILSDKLGAEGAATLHSDYIDALVSSGALGFVMILLIMFGLLWKAYRHAVKSGDAIAMEILGVVVILMVRSFSGTTVASHNVFLILLFSIAVYLRVFYQNHNSYGAKYAPSAC